MREQLFPQFSGGAEKSNIARNQQCSSVRSARNRPFRKLGKQTDLRILADFCKALRRKHHFCRCKRLCGLAGQCSRVPIPAPMISNWRIRVPPFYAISLSVSSAACTVQARSFCVCTDETNIASN